MNDTIALLVAEREQLRSELEQLRAELAAAEETIIAFTRLNHIRPPKDDDRTFHFRPAGQDTDAEVALHEMGQCGICVQPIAAGAFVVNIHADDDSGVNIWAHELCANPPQAHNP